jgi:hypothetical protein
LDRRLLQAAGRKELPITAPLGRDARAGNDHENAASDWHPDEEQLCVPSEMLQYLQLIGEPGGSGVPAGK